MAGTHYQIDFTKQIMLSNCVKDNQKQVNGNRTLVVTGICYLLTIKQEIEN